MRQSWWNYDKYQLCLIQWMHTHDFNGYDRIDKYEIIGLVKVESGNSQILIWC